MKLFTFSGIAGSFSDTNDGHNLKELAAALLDDLPSGLHATYDGREGATHFSSHINFTTLLGQLGVATLFDGSPVLNAESRDRGPSAAITLSTATAADPAEDVLILAHSQGCNNATFALRYLFDTQPDFFSDRAVRVVFFDPKVGPSRVQDLFVLGANHDFPFLFFQSERDLLSNQGVFGTRFIDQFPHGNHLWVAGIGHGDIIDYGLLGSPKRRWLLQKEYPQYLRDLNKERMRLETERGRPGLTAVQLAELEKYRNAYKMNVGGLTPALVGFAQGQLAKRFQS